MNTTLFTRLSLAFVCSLILVCGAIAQDKKADGSKTGPQTSSDATASPSTIQINGVISSVSRHEGTSMFEIKVKDTAGKKHDISISPSAVIKQGDQKIASSSLQKGASVQIDAYVTPSGSTTAKTILITTTTASTQK